MAWDYKREESTNYKTNIPEGKHRVRIVSAEKAQSKNGNDMLTLKFDVSGYKDTVYHYIVFMPDKAEMTNQKLTQFFDSFKDIPDGDFDTSHWVGKVGACTIKHEEYNGNINPKIGYFIAADKAADLPAWREVAGMAGGIVATSTGGTDGFVSIPDGIDGDLPF